MARKQIIQIDLKYDNITPFMIFYFICSEQQHSLLNIKVGKKVDQSYVFLKLMLRRFNCLQGFQFIH